MAIRTRTLCARYRPAFITVGHCQTRCRTFIAKRSALLMLTTLLALIALFERPFFNGMRNHILIQKVQQVPLRTFVLSPLITLLEGRSEEQAPICVDLQLSQSIDDGPTLLWLVGTRELLEVETWYGLQE